MTKFYKILLAFLFVFALFVQVSADNVLKATITAFPDGLYGTWRVESRRIDTDSPSTFRLKGVDIWNFSQENDVIYLSNPFSGATAQVNVEGGDSKHVVFSKTGRYGNKLLTDTVDITVEGDSFTGYNTLHMETVSNIDGRVMKTESAKYSINGDKIAGNNIKIEDK